MTQYKYKTSMHITLLGEGSNHGVPIEFEYTVDKSYPATHEQPAEGGGVNISKITLTDSKGIRYRAHDWLWELFNGDEELTAELLAEASADDDSARELRDALRGEHIA